MTRGSMRIAAGCGFLVLSMAMVAWGRHGVVTTKQGESFEGEITEKGAIVIVDVKGKGQVKLQRANIQPIEFTAGPAEQFAEKMSKLAKNDAKGRVDLARWAMDQQEYDLAVSALDAAIAIDPNNEEARQILKVVETKRRSAHNAAAQPATKPSSGNAAGKTNVPDTAAKDDRQTGPKAARLVTPEEINHIRQVELQKGEMVQIRLLGDVKQVYLASSEFTPIQWNKMTPQQQAYEIISNGSSKLHKDVIVASDPASLAQYKSLVQRNIIPGCASMQCHGGPNAGTFKLFSPANKEADSYTNFLLMQEYKTTIDKMDYAMIDRARAENSLVLQFGLPPEVAVTPHPKVPNFKPIFKGKNDPKYKQIVEWASRTLAAITPDYGIDLTKPPEGDATTRPTRERQPAK